MQKGQKMIVKKGDMFYVQKTIHSCCSSNGDLIRASSDGKDIGFFVYCTKSAQHLIPKEVYSDLKLLEVIDESRK